MASYNQENHMILMKTQVRNVIWFLKKSSYQHEILNVEITYYPYIILITYQQSSEMISSRSISSHLSNILLTMFIQLIDHYIETCIYVVIYILVLTLSFSSISDPLSSSNLIVSTWPPRAAFISAVTPDYY